MDFLGLGFGEILLVMIVALLVFGPARIPEIARTIGLAVRNLRQFTSNFTTAMNKELELEEQRSHQPPAALTGETAPVAQDKAAPGADAAGSTGEQKP